jgi:hypothetical protein
MVTDCPYAETHEQLAGYFLIDAKNLDVAISIAARVPAPVSGRLRFARSETFRLPAAS